MSADRYQNFRLQGIPCECETRADVRELVKKILCIAAGASVVVHSLATSPTEQISKVATLSFHPLPDYLSDCTRNEWVFNLPADETEDGFSCRKSLVFDTHFSGFTPLQHTKDDDCYVDVIALSGLGGHAFGSFKERHGSFMWLRDALPIDVPGARILIYGYETGLIRSSSFQNLSDLGKALQIDMRGIRGLTQSRPIVFIGHSLGGLVIKEAIVKLKEALDEKDTCILSSTSGFLFFGVPHQGMAIESLVPLVKDYPNRSLLESLNKNSALLQRLEKDFGNAFGKRSVRIVSFYETEKSPTAVEMEDGKWKLSGDAEVLVDVSSATCGSKHQHPINRNHSEMVKYNNQYDELYKRVRIALEPLVSRLQSKSVTVSTEVGSCPLVPSSDENIDCLRSLSFREQDHRYKEIYSANNTCEWLLEDSQYQAWMNKPRGLFWIKGNPGAGKSVLMKFAATMMDRRKSGELVVSFFVHGRGTPLQKTPLGIFRALLNSMLKSFPEHLSQLTKRFNDQEIRFGTYQENRWSWAEEELQDLISEVLTKGTKNRPVAIFVDAIDECGQGHAKNLLEYFKSIMNNVEREEAQVKICFSSRHFPLLGLDTMSTISVEERNDKDIRLVIQERLSQIQPKTKRRQMEKDILLKAQGGFQWVILTTTIVTDGITIGTKAEKLHEKITTTPEALDELYTDILSGATEAEHHQMTKLFQWVLFAERPLSTHELREALATDRDMTCTTVSELKSHDSWSDSLEDFEKHVRHISRGLVEFNTRDIWEQYEPDGEDSDREAQFIHQSVADYILGKFLDHVRPGDGTQSQIGAGHFELSRSCLRYLTLEEVSEGAQLPRGTFSARFPLVPYVVRFVFHHILEVEREGIPQCDLLTLIQWDRQSGFLRKIVSIWRVMDPNNAHALGATPLHALVALGSKSAFDALLQKNDVEVDCRDSEGYTPLLLALRECRQDMALALLNRSIEWQLRSQSTTQDNNIGHRRNYFVDVNAENDDGETPLTIALTVNAGEVIFKLIEAGADLKYFGKQTALVVYAIRNRNKTLLLKFLEKNVKLDGTVYSALRELSYKDDDDDVLEEYLLELLKAGANMGKSPDFNKSYEDGSDDEDEDEGEGGALLLASRRGQTAIVNLFLSYGASASSRNKYGRFPLLEATENGHEPIVKLLLENGGDVNAKSTGTNGCTLLWVALQNRHKAITRLLITNGVDVNAGDEDGLTPLIWAVQVNDETLATLLINNGADVNARDKEESTPLMWAVLDNDETLATLLINNGADVNPCDKEKSTPLMWAVHNNNETLATLFINNGADVNACDKEESTPLMWAVQDNNETLATLLINNGADVNACDKEKSTPLMWAVQDNNETLATLLINNGADVNASDEEKSTPLMRAVWDNYETLVRLLIIKGSDVNASDDNGFTPLIWASQQDYTEMAMLLITGNANVNASDKDGLTPLIWAVRNGHKAVARLLIDNRVNVNASDNNGFTPLIWASQQDYTEIAMLLITGNANVNASDNNGLTPLIWAVRNSHEAVARLLIDNGANVDATDKYGLPPLLWASLNGNEAVSKLLIDNGADINGSKKGILTLSL